MRRSICFLLPRPRGEAGGGAQASGADAHPRLFRGAVLVPEELSPENSVGACGVQGRAGRGSTGGCAAPAGSFRRTSVLVSSREGGGDLLRGGFAVLSGPPLPLLVLGGGRLSRDNGKQLGPVPFVIKVTASGWGWEGKQLFLLAKPDGAEVT